MKAPHLRLLTVTAASVAMLTGMSAVVADAAAAAPATHASHASVTAARPKGHIHAPVTGTFTTKAGRGTFTGRFMPKKFSVVNGVLEATGRLTGRMVGANGAQLGKVSKTVTIPVDTGRASGALPACSILNLKLGPINLNLLGLVVHLNRVHLTITAVPGPGNLLGNLLCRITHLLDSGGSLSKIATLLNRVLAML